MRFWTHHGTKLGLQNFRCGTCFKIFKNIVVFVKTLHNNYNYLAETPSTWTQPIGLITVFCHARHPHVKLWVTSCDWRDVVGLEIKKDPVNTWLYITSPDSIPQLPWPEFQNSPVELQSNWYFQILVTGQQY